MTALKPRRIDLYECFFEKAPITRAQEQRIVTILLPIVLLLIIGGSYGYLEYSIYRLNQQIAPVATYLNTVDTQTLHQQADALQIEDDRLTAIAKSLIVLDAAADSYPHLTKDMMSAIFSHATDRATVTGISYDSGNGTISIAIETDRPENGQDYMERLRTSGYFSAISHTGYTGGETPVIDTANSVYKVDILAKLPPPTEDKP